MTVRTDEPKAKQPFWVRVGIQTFAYSVGLAIFVTVDHYTHWIGIVK